MYSGWHDQARLASLRGSLLHAATRTQKSWPTWNRRGKKHILVHQNVTAILTAVHATGGHVLWVNPPYSSAIHLDVVQYFLSNRATYWLWVDACRFDVNVDKTWLFATSSPGLLPLASQCNREFQCKNTRHPRMRDPHTKFPPALCAKFAKLIVLFVSRDFRGVFTLWTDAVTPGPATVDKPSRLPADKITTWTPTMLYVGRGRTIAHKTFPASPWCNSFKVSVFDRTEAIKRYNNVLAEDPLKSSYLR